MLLAYLARKGPGGIITAMGFPRPTYILALSSSLFIAGGGCSAGGGGTGTSLSTGGVAGISSASGGFGTGLTGSSGGGPVLPPGGAAGAGVVIPPVSTATCGDGLQNEGETCDDLNKNNGDGCNAICQVEADWSCPAFGQPCVFSAICGDGKLATFELCDDTNPVGGDGCSADCMIIEPGWECRVPGRACTPICGDGILLGSEKCDDGKLPAASGDGCSSTCLPEPGYDCGAALPSVCTPIVCGNGVKENNEGCDEGPEGNGLFFGNATGCSKTCTKEPDCRPGGVTQACAAVCGDGNVDSGEACDDGNTIDLDGCSAGCAVEPGFTCTNQDMPDTVPCPSNPAETCLVLPILLRDFEGQNVSGGHPDFFYMGAGSGTDKTLCVPNAAGTPAAVSSTCSSTDATGACEGLVQPALGPTGKPVLAGASGVCDCRFTDWDQTGVITASTTGSDQCTVEGDGSTRYRVGYKTPLQVTVIQSADTFNEWYSDTLVTPIRGSLELAATGTAGQYQFSSSDGNTVYEDLHAICLNAKKTGPLESGFFPLEDASGSKTCNIWPYWIAGLNSEAKCCAGSGCPLKSQWDPLASYDNCPTEGEGGPVPNSGGDQGKVQGKMRNFYFTTEVRYLFRFDGTAKTLAFYGDDDVWVFINGKLALDLGAPHERLEGKVVINNSFGLEAGKVYEIAVFHADRHPRESNYQLTLSGFSTSRSFCAPRCGDGQITAGEECDDGDGVNSDTAYGGCTTQCKFGAFCGDGTVNGPETCDAGRNNGVGYGADNCSSGCTVAHFCGDFIADTAFDEECDAGPLGNTNCNEKCEIVVR